MSTPPTNTTSSSSLLETGDFLLSEIRILEKSGIFVGPYIPGSFKRTVRMSALDHPLAPNQNPNPAPPNPNASVTISFSNYPSTPSNRTMTLPIAAESAATLEFIGFVPSTAQRIFEDWAKRPDPENCPDDLLAYAIADVRGMNRHNELADNPKDTMQAMGLDKEFSDTLLDPEHEDVRGTGSMMYWIRDTLEIRYKTIRMLQRRLKRRVEMIGEQREREGS